MCFRFVLLLLKRKSGLEPTVPGKIFCWQPRITKGGSAGTWSCGRGWHGWCG